MAHLVFVHGTGVRQDAFNKQFQTVEKALPAWQVSSCFWGKEHGVKLNHGGDSIPGYEAAPGSEENKIESQWELLYQDPLCELRQHASLLGAQGEFSFNQPDDEQTPGEALKVYIESYQPSQALQPLLRATQLHEVWPDAFARIIGSPEFAAAVDGYTPEDESPIGLIARALVAASIATGLERGLPLPDADARDELVRQLAYDLGQRQYRSFLEKALFSFYLRPLTWYAERRRTVISDGAFPAAGDILLYQRSGQDIRDFIETEIKRAANECGDKVVVLAHSLGGIACFDLLAKKPDLPVKALITAGSQAPLLYEMDCLESLRCNDKRKDALPAAFPRWLNVFDRQDLLSYIGENLFGKERVEDFEVKSGQPFPISHSAYWQMDAFWKKVVEFVG